MSTDQQLPPLRVYQVSGPGIGNGTTDYSIVEAHECRPGLSGVLFTQLDICPFIGPVERVKVFFTPGQCSVVIEVFTPYTPKSSLVIN